jgi:hypothetical protein
MFHLLGCGGARQMKSKEPMLEPKRSDKAAAAYAEFMKGLSMVQQMEVNPSIFPLN